MSEWWTYRPSDLLMFAPRTYWRLFELHNEALWPWQLLPALLALFIAWALLRRRPGGLRAGLAALAACWALVAWAFLWRRYAPINTAGGAFAIAFALQALGLLALSIAGGLHATDDTARRRTGLALLAWAVLAHPLVVLAAGRPWSQAEWFGLAPDPTTIGTLGVLLCVQARQRLAGGLLGVLRAGALAWCAVSAATLWTMGSPQGWVLALGAVAALAVLVLARRRA